MALTDMTAIPNLIESNKGTGPIRFRRPVYLDFLPPCNNACPAGENIQKWLDLAQGGHYKEAWQVLIEDNPLPAVHGRVCYHPCETSCNRTETDEPINIHAVERFLGDLALEKGWKPKIIAEPSGKKVLIIGAGPSGLSAAYHLARLGHEVEIRESSHIAGGMVRFGIPSYRMPPRELDAEIKRIENMGVKITLNTRVDNVLKDKVEGGFDAVFIAVGAQLGREIHIPGSDKDKVIDAVNFLRDVKSENPPQLGKRVAVYGGGNTAMDAARTARRLGVEEVMVVYRRDRGSMPAHDFEVEEALEEGVEFHFLRTIQEIDHSTLIVEVMALDDKGYPQATGEKVTLDIDNIILAVGQISDTNFLQYIPDIEFKRDGTVIVGSDMMTGQEGIFAGGDMIPEDRSVTIAVGHGKKAARFINGYLTGIPYQQAPKHPVIYHEKLHLWYRTDAPQREQNQLPPEQRTSNFDEILQGLTEQEARFEAQRCLSCGNCFECDGCYGSCPEDAIIKLGPGKRYQYIYDRCTGCAVCYEQCPCHAIEMQAEPTNSTNNNELLETALHKEV
jgi:NADPH-dependent glutamate synthase beta subunit-like oxidoreductase